MLILNIEASIESSNGGCYLQVGDLKVVVDRITYNNIKNEQLRQEQIQQEIKEKESKRLEKVYKEFYSCENPYEEK